MVPASAGPTMPIQTPLVPDLRPVAQEPFGWTTVAIPESPLTAKWHTLERAVETDMQLIAECHRYADTCTPEARRFNAIVNDASTHDALARIGSINRAINLAIRPQSDWTLNGEEDHWSSPLETLTAGAGDCEDYAIAKYVALRMAGLSADDLRLVIAYDSRAHEEHALVAARHDGRWRLLDNRHLALMEDSSAGWYRPMYVIDSAGPRRYELRDTVPAALVTVRTSNEKVVRDEPNNTRPVTGDATLDII